MKCEKGKGNKISAYEENGKKKTLFAIGGRNGRKRKNNSP
jgi:hypothetical protein